MRSAARTKPRLGQFRAQAGLSQTALAEAIGVKQSTVSFYESGEAKPNLERALHIAQQLGQPVEVLWPNLAPAKRGKVVGKIGPTPRPQHQQRRAAPSGAEVRSETPETGGNHETA